MDYLDEKKAPWREGPYRLQAGLAVVADGHVMALAQGELAGGYKQNFSSPHVCERGLLWSRTWQEMEDEGDVRA
jgi:hypothetical protein